MAAPRSAWEWASFCSNSGRARDREQEAARQSIDIRERERLLARQSIDIEKGITISSVLRREEWYKATRGLL
jgi:hypothetical protein